MVCVFARAIAGATPLFITAQNGGIDLARFLLANKATVDCAKLDGATPLHIAAEKGHTVIVKLLIDNGADVHVCALTGAEGWGGVLETLE